MCVCVSVCERLSEKERESCVSYSSGFLPWLPMQLGLHTMCWVTSKGWPCHPDEYVHYTTHAHAHAHARAHRKQLAEKQESVNLHRKTVNATCEICKNLTPHAAASPPQGSAVLIALHQCSLKFLGEPCDKYLRGWGHTPHTLQTHSSGWI